MNLAPTNQIHPAKFLDSFQSLSKFHGSRLLFLRQSSSNVLKKHYFCLPNSTCSMHAPYQHNPSKKSKFPSERHRNAFSRASETVISQSHPVGGSSSRSWIDKWKENRPLNLAKNPKAVADYRNGAVSSEDDQPSSDDGNGYRSRSSNTMDKIVEKLMRFGYVDDMIEREERLPEKGSVDDIFYAEDGILPNSRGGISGESQLGMELKGSGDGEVRFPWEKPKEEEMDRELMRKRLRSKTAMAELTLPESELRRLRNLAIRMKSRVKIGGMGVTQAVVDDIHEKWKSTEVVKLKFEGTSALNMRRTHEILERKTGGLVIWRSGTSLCLYRGVGYEVAPMQLKKQLPSGHEIGPNSSGMNHMIPHKTDEDSTDSLSAGNGSTDSPEMEKVKPEIIYENEINELLDGLGPRFSDWPGGDPLPVDADLLPGVVPGYKEPFRILPYGIRSPLRQKDMIALRRLARVLPPHFALGRSRQHQGLAVAMVKLWEKSSIAKIALKRGVQLTSSERMAEDIKKLTGGTILIRNKEYIVFYRGKDFLSPELAEALLERKRLAQALQDEEERARLQASSSVIQNLETSEESRISGAIVAGAAVAGTLGETLDADARWGKRLNDDHRNKMTRAAEAAKHADLVRKLESRLSHSERKLVRAERALAKVEAFLKPAERSTDADCITDEERFMFRKLGLRMKAFLLLGRRGVFDGTVENMHLHWKYRELVKIIVKEKNFAQVKNIALSLESESGGVLVSVDKISKGYAIVVYRGKDYKRPQTLRPKNLLTKRKALARSIELQRHEALHKHVAALNRRVEKLRYELDQVESVKDQGEEELYAKLDSAYHSADEYSEDEGDEAYVETYYSRSDSDDDYDDMDAVDSVHSEVTLNEQQNAAEDSDDDASRLEMKQPTEHSLEAAHLKPKKQFSNL